MYPADFQNVPGEFWGRLAIQQAHQAGTSNLTLRVNEAQQTRSLPMKKPLNKSPPNLLQIGQLDKKKMLGLVEDRNFEFVTVSIVCF